MRLLNKYFNFDLWLSLDISDIYYICRDPLQLKESDKISKSNQLSKLMNGKLKNIFWLRLTLYPLNSELWTKSKLLLLKKVEFCIYMMIHSSWNSCNIKFQTNLIEWKLNKFKSLESSWKCWNSSKVLKHLRSVGWIRQGLIHSNSSRHLKEIFFEPWNTYQIF